MFNQPLDCLLPVKLPLAPLPREQKAIKAIRLKEGKTKTSQGGNRASEQGSSKAKAAVRAQVRPSASPRRGPMTIAIYMAAGPSPGTLLEPSQARSAWIAVLWW